VGCGVDVLHVAAGERATRIFARHGEPQRLWGADLLLFTSIGRREGALGHTRATLSVEGAAEVGFEGAGRPGRNVRFESSAALRPSDPVSPLTRFRC
jgi:hypothetical protein